jgi:uncharacterized protein
VVFYVETSALATLVVSEEHSAALRAWFRRHDTDCVTSDLTRTELLRATRRVAPDRAGRAQQVLDRIEILGLAPGNYQAAGLLDPPALRALDALHLVAARELGEELAGFLTYDTRVAAAAATDGMKVVAPGRKA